MNLQISNQLNKWRSETTICQATVMSRNSPSRFICFMATSVLFFVPCKAETEIYGLFRNRSHETVFNEARAKLKSFGINATGNVFNIDLNLGLNQFIEKGHSLTRLPNVTRNNSVFIFNDLNNMKNEIVRELSEYQTANAAEQLVYLDNALSGTPQLLSHVQEIDDLVSFLDTMFHPANGVSIAVDNTEMALAGLVHMIEKCVAKGRDVLSIQVLGDTIDSANAIALNMRESDFIIVDADEKKTIQLIHTVKHLGLLGFRENLNWLMTKRSVGQIAEHCNVPHFSYWFLDPFPISLTADYITEKVKGCRNQRSTALCSKTLRNSSVKEFITEFKVWMPMETSQIEPVRFYLPEQTSTYEDPALPVVRVAISYATPPWVIIKEFETHSHRVICGREGMLATQNDTKICAYGFAIDMLRILKTKLSFNPRIFVSRDRLYGSYNEKTGTSDGIVREILENQADIGLDMMENKGRSKALAFSNGYLIATVALAYIQSGQFDDSSIFGPFSTKLWITILGSIVGLMAFIWALEHVSPYGTYQINQRKLESIGKFNAVDSATFVWGTYFTGEIIDKKPKSFGSRAAIIAVSFVSILVISAYSGNLITYLVVLDETPPINGLFDEKLIGRESKIKVGLVKGTYVSGFLEAHSDVRVRRLHSRVKNFTTIKECISSLKRRDIDIVINDYLTLKYQMDIDHSCSLRVAKVPNSAVPTAIPSRKNWTWIRTVNTAINHMVFSGEADVLVSKWFRQETCKKAVNFSALDIQRMLELFYLLATAIAATIMIALICNLINRLKIRNVSRPRIDIEIAR